MNRDVQLRVEGTLLDRLLQRALGEGAQFARIRRVSQRCMIIETDSISARRFMKLCRRYGYSCREERRGGRTGLWERLRGRWTLLPGIALGALICLMLLTRLWLVEIEFTGAGAQPGVRDEILQCLRGNGIRTGMSLMKINTDDLQKQLLAQLPSCSHAGVRLQGIRLLAQVTLEDPAPKLYEIEFARDLVSLQNGVVQEINVYSGQACVQTGDTVLRGETLIRGEENVGKNVETGEAITAPVGARGEVIARCWYEGYASAPLSATVSRRTGKTRTSARLTLMNLALPMPSQEGFPAEEVETEILPIVGLFLPLQLERSTHYETTETTIPADPEALKAQLSLLARADALRQIRLEKDAYEIASSWTEESLNGNTLQIRAVYEIYTDIAAERDALIEEVY